MHAMVLNRIGADLQWTELPDRQPGPGEIRVRVLACGVCRTDLHVYGHRAVRLRRCGAHHRAGGGVARAPRVRPSPARGDVATQEFASRLGATWAGGSDEAPPEQLDAAIIFATAGDLVPLALRAVRKRGRVVCAGIHMSDIPSFPYELLWEGRQIVSVANPMRQDGRHFLRLVPEIGVVTSITRYPLVEANRALSDLRAGRFNGQPCWCREQAGSGSSNSEGYDLSMNPGTQRRPSRQADRP